MTQQEAMQEAQRIPITGGYILVDVEDVEQVTCSRWHLHKSDASSYAARTVTVNGKKKHLFLHRWLLGLTWEPELRVDHINGDTLDNRRRNLRICTNSQNTCNSHSGPRTKTRYFGVGKRSGNRKGFEARITHNGKTIYLGRSNTPEGAAMLYNVAAIELHGQFAKLNSWPAALADADRRGREK